MSDPTQELICGPARLYVAPYGTALPTYAQIADLAAGTLSGFTYLGDTTEAVNLTDEPTFITADSQQAGRALDMAVTQNETKVATTMRGATVAKLAAWVRGSAARDGITAKVTPGAVGPVPKFVLAFVGPWTDDTDCLFAAPRVAYSRGMELALNADEFAAFPVEFTVLAPGAGAPFELTVPDDTEPPA